ncbi:MAG TPA: EfeM/EfeO family lipoprotein [Solirubrobacteraceae bacterium]|nr:EfeM/EfeO family lipoprotein [Solirubrobacteraceae bacterium]
MPERIGPLGAATAFVATLALVLALAAPGAVAGAAQRACGSYPAPGSLAPPSSAVPKAILSRYGVLRRKQRVSDRFDLRRVRDQLSVAGLIRSSERLLGRAASGERVYVVAARHLLGFRLAPLRCLPASQRALEQQLAPGLRKQYRNTAVCVVVVTAAGDKPSCAATTSRSEALLTAVGASFGLVPDGVRAVSLRYLSEPPRTLPVRHNFFADATTRSQSPPCGLQWLGRDGTVRRTPVGCSYRAAEAQELAEYRGYVAAQLATLQPQVSALRSAIAGGSLAAAESAWLSAHQTWLTIGQDDGAYGCFGDLGGAIDGLAGGLPLGTADPGFTGFHRIEYDLWTSHDLSAAASDTQTLQGLLGELLSQPLASYLPASANGIANWVLRPHEVFEDADRDTLSGDDDYGSGSELASLSADLTAVRTMLGDLAPTLDQLAPRLVENAAAQLDALGAEIEVTQAGGGSVAIPSLPLRQRQQIDADVGALLETLAPIPDLLTSTGKGSPTT